MGRDRKQEGEGEKEGRGRIGRRGTRCGKRLTVIVRSPPCSRHPRCRRRMGWQPCQASQSVAYSKNPNIPPAHTRDRFTPLSPPLRPSPPRLLTRSPPHLVFSPPLVPSFHSRPRCSRTAPPLLPSSPLPLHGSSLLPHTSNPLSPSLRPLLTPPSLPPNTSSLPPSVLHPSPSCDAHLSASPSNTSPERSVRTDSKS